MFKSIRLISVLVFVLLISIPLTVLAQEGPEMEEYVSSDGLLTLSYPKDWFIMEDENPVMIMKDSGEKIVIILQTIDQFSATMGGVEVAEERPADYWASLCVEVLNTANNTQETEESDQANQLQISEPSVVDLTNDLQAGYFRTSGEESEETVILYEKDAVIVMVLAMTFPEQYTEELDTQVLAVASSIKYTGTADDLAEAADETVDTESSTNETDSYTVWQAEAEIGTFTISLNSDGTAITGVNYDFSKWRTSNKGEQCGPVPPASATYFLDEIPLPLSGNFLLKDLDLGEPSAYHDAMAITISGKFDRASSTASGTWLVKAGGLRLSGCDGQWSAAPVTD